MEVHVQSGGEAVGAGAESIVCGRGLPSDGRSGERERDCDTLRADVADTDLREADGVASAERPRLPPAPTTLEAESNVTSGRWGRMDRAAVGLCSRSRWVAQRARSRAVTVLNDDGTDAVKNDDDG